MRVGDARFWPPTATAAPLLRLAAPFVGCVVFGLCVATSTPALADSTEQRQIDPARSVAQFSIEHIFVDRVTGTVPILSGSVTIPAGSAIPVRVTAVLDPSRIESGDRDRDSSLESPDYFDIKAFPTWTFASTKIVPSSANACAMDGMLTIHGIIAPEHLEVTIRGDSAHPVYHAVGHIDRHAFGMKGARLDPVIGNVADVTLDITVK
jgi:polyisoprenoid-binding protein YceI